MVVNYAAYDVGSAVLEHEFVDTDNSTDVEEREELQQTRFVAPNALSKKHQRLEALNKFRNDDLLQEQTHSSGTSEYSVESDQIIDSARRYQQELYERAKSQNTIVVLDTGMGKTLIAAMLIRDVLRKEIVNRSLGKQPRTVFFLANSVALVQQQARMLKYNLGTSVIDLYGETNLDLWTIAGWRPILESQRVVVCTPSVLHTALLQSCVQMSHICLLVFDEAHHCKKDHPYSKIMRNFYFRTKGIRPRIFGMTASPVDSKRDIHTTITELEDMLHSKILTTKDLSLFDFANTPLDETWFYSRSGQKGETELYTRLEPLLQILPNLRTDLNLALEYSAELDTWFADQILHHTVLVPFHKPNSLIKKLERSQAYADMISIGERQAAVSLVHSIVDMCLKLPKILPMLQTPITSPKVQRLYRGLLQQFARNPATRAMVFVGRRWTASLLRDCFMYLSAPNIRPACLIGGGNNSGPESIHVRRQQEVLNHFKSGLINLIFVTSVAEEGIDIPQCNLVVRFDIYNTTIQYMQSRGRARMKNSIYAHMLEEDSEEHPLMQYVTESANYLKTYCQTLPADRLLGGGTQLKRLIAKDNAHIGFQTSSGAICNFHNCQVILSRYASSLQHIGATSTEVYDLTIIEESRTLFQYNVRIPKVGGSIVGGARGDSYKNKHMAKCSAAYKCIRYLRSYELLDTDLKSIFRAIKPHNLNARLAVAAKQDAYDKQIKSNLMQRGIGNVPKSLFVCIVELKPSRGLAHAAAPIALLTRYPLPPIPGFSLFVEGSIQVSVNLTHEAQALPVTNEHVQLLTNYTLRAVFEDVFNKTYEHDPSSMTYWLAPVKYDRRPDAHGLLDILDFESMLLAQQPRMKWSATSQNPDWRNSFLVDPHDGKYHYFTSDSEPSLKVFDPMPSKIILPTGKKGRKNIVDFTDSHWRKSRNQQFSSLWDLNQPVLLADMTLLNRNFLEPRTVNSGFVHCYIAPQPLELGRIAPKVAATILTWPSVLHRIESCLIALEAFEKIGLRDMPPGLALEAFTKDVEHEETEEHEAKAHHQESGKNYERLEFIGDSLLKMMTTITIFNLTTCDEMGMHCRRMELLCNRRLYTVATGSLELYRNIRTAIFDRDAWYPEYLTLLKGRGAQKPPAPVRHGPTQHLLGMKTIADVCEAMIGAAVMTTKNQPLETRFDLGIEAITRLVESEDHNIKTWAEVRKIHTAPDWQLKLDDPIANDIASKLERVIGYKFKYPRLARSAFTHSSMNSPVPDLQRLEFLGDACFDWVCIFWLFDSNQGRNPQWLTEHKMAMVSNKFLAALAVMLGLDQLLETNTASLMADIFEYSTTIRQLHDQKDCKPDFWTQVGHPPKALADLVESTLGAILVDSNFDYNEIQLFFDRHVKKFFVDIEAYDTFANRHPTSYVYRRLTDDYGCVDFGVLTSDVDEAQLDSELTAGVLVHNQVIASSKGPSARYAKTRASKNALNLLHGLSVRQFREKFGCECPRGLQMLAAEEKLKSATEA